MAKPTKYTATAPDGTTVTRNSHRTYSHVVVVRHLHKGELAWQAFAWCGRRDLAEKKRNKALNALHLEIEILEVSA